MHENAIGKDVVGRKVFRDGEAIGVVTGLRTADDGFDLVIEPPKLPGWELIQDTCSNCGQKLGDSAVTVFGRSSIYCSTSCRDHDHRWDLFPKPIDREELTRIREWLDHSEKALMNNNSIEAAVIIERASCALGKLLSP